MILEQYYLGLPRARLLPRRRRAHARRPGRRPAARRRRSTSTTPAAWGVRDSPRPAHAFPRRLRRRPPRAARPQGATIYLGASARAEYAVRPLGDGRWLELGPTCASRCSETPGHTPEIDLDPVVHDVARGGAAPYAVLDRRHAVHRRRRPPRSACLARLEGARSSAGLLTTRCRQAARLPDATLVYPAHGAGSLCGRNLSKETSRRSASSAAQLRAAADEPERVRRLVTADQPDSPPYFAYDAVLNPRSGRRSRRRSSAELRPLATRECSRLRRRGRAHARHARSGGLRGCAPSGSVNFGLGGSYATWCGTMLDAEAPVAARASRARAGGGDAPGPDRLRRCRRLLGRMQRSRRARTWSPASSASPRGALADKLESAGAPLVGRGPGGTRMARDAIGESVKSHSPGSRSDSTSFRATGRLVVALRSGYRSAISGRASFLQRFGAVARPPCARGPQPRSRLVPRRGRCRAEAGSATAFPHASLDAASRSAPARPVTCPSEALPARARPRPAPAPRQWLRGARAQRPTSARRSSV